MTSCNFTHLIVQPEKSIKSEWVLCEFVKIQLSNLKKSQTWKLAKRCARGFIWQTLFVYRLFIYAAENCGKMMKSSYVSLQPRHELEPDNTQSGGPVSFFPAWGQTAGDSSGEVTAVFLVTWCYFLIASLIKKKRKELNLELVPVTDSFNVLKSIVRHWDCYLIWQVRPTKAVNKSLRCHISSRCQDQVVKFRFSCKPLCLYMCTCTVCCCSCSHRRRWLWGASRSCSWASDSGNVGMWGSTVRTRARGGDFLKNGSLFFSFTWASSK